jgi:hypothetical protein
MPWAMPSRGTPRPAGVCKTRMRNAIHPAGMSKHEMQKGLLQFRF